MVERPIGVRFAMSNPDGLDEQIRAMEEALMADTSLRPDIRAYLHLQAAKRLLSETAGVAEMERLSRSGLIPTRGSGKIARRVDPDRVRVLEQAANLIRESEFPTKTAEIYEGLAPEVRALIRGSDPKGNLSAMLFHSPAFDSHGRQGWTLSGSKKPSSGTPDESASDEDDDIG